MINYDTGFIVPLVSSKNLFLKPSVMTRNLVVGGFDFTDRQVYDVVAVSTFVSYFVAKYWEYPNKKDDRSDVELFSYLMGIIWHVMYPFNLNIYLFLILIGGYCHYMKLQMLVNNHTEDAMSDHVPIQAGGQISSLLLLLDLMNFR